MLKTFVTIFKALFNFVKYPIFIVMGLICLFYLLVIINFIIKRFKGIKLKKGKHKRLKKDGILKDFFINLPKRYTEDLLERDPDFFPHQGLIIFEAPQGGGKTSALVQFIIDLRKSFPKAKTTTNLAYKDEDHKLKDWHDLITYKNGLYGVIVGLDELQNWFGSNLSRNFPPEMLQVITQNRKNRRVLLRNSPEFLSFDADM